MKGEQVEEKMEGGIGGMGGVRGMIRGKKEGKWREARDPSRPTLIGRH